MSSDAASGTLLLLGATGLLGQAVRREATKRGMRVIGVARSGDVEVKSDLIDTDATASVIRDAHPIVVLNAAANTNLEACERDPGAAYLLHTRLPSVVSSLCNELGCRYVHISTDQYYVGDGAHLHDEAAPVTLVNEYARTKFAGEALAAISSNTLIVRTNIVGFRGWEGRPTFAEWALAALASGKEFPAFDDFWTSSIDVGSFAEAVFDLVSRNATGLLNVAASTACTKLEFVRQLAGRTGLDASKAVPSSVRSVSSIPRATSLGLDVRRAERLLGRSLPDSAQVIENIIMSLKESGQ